jgi:hypothetical protein
MQREEVRNMIERDGSAKGIVFSQFTSFLDLIQFSLEKVKSQKTFSGVFAAMFIHYWYLIWFGSLASNVSNLMDPWTSMRREKP